MCALGQYFYSVLSMAMSVNRFGSGHNHDNVLLVEFRSTFIILFYQDEKA